MTTWPRQARRRVAATILAVGVATSVVACGGSSSAGGGGSGGGGTTAATTTGASSTAAPTQSSSTAAQSSSTAAQTSSASAGATGSSSAAGLKVFTSAGCGSCHTLAAAHATGQIGPNLDVLKPSEARVARQVTNGGAAMPSFSGRLSKTEIAAVAKFVASAAG